MIWGKGQNQIPKIQDQKPAAPCAKDYGFAPTLTCARCKDDDSRSAWMNDEGKYPCGTLAGMGWCTNVKYEKEMAARCPASCGLCSTGTTLPPRPAAASASCAQSLPAGAMAGLKHGAAVFEPRPRVPQAHCAPCC